MKQLHPKAVWLFFFRSFPLIIIVFLIIGGNGYSLVRQLFPEVDILNIVKIYSLLSIILLIIIAYIFAKLSYRFYKYELTPEGFKKESGIITKSYTTIPYERIQNVDIHRGVLSRILGLSYLIIQTAGLSGMSGSEGILPGISQEEAEKLRDQLIAKSK